MNSLCEETRNLVADTFAGILTSDQPARLEKHLSHCAACRAYTEDLKAEHQQLTQLVARLDHDMTERQQHLLNASYGRQQTKPPSKWSFLMKSKRIRTPIAAAIIVAVMILLNPFENQSPNVAWARVVDNMLNARTVTWKTTSSEDRSTFEHHMVLEPDYERIEYPDGTIKIADHGQEVAVLLDPANKVARVGYAKKIALNSFGGLRSLISNPTLPQEIGSRQINGKQAIGFRWSMDIADGVNENVGVLADGTPLVKFMQIIWVDPDTETPILIEYESVSAKGDTFNIATYDIAFGVELDVSLFSLEIPPGYKIQEDPKQYDLMQSASHMNDILKACAIYANQHDDQWPESLDELELEGIDVGQYVYHKPTVPGDGRQVVLYDAYDQWQGGISVGFANCRVQLINNESDFKQMLEVE